MKRNNSTKRFAANVKAAREVINYYFDNLSETIVEIPPVNVYKFDEMNVTDDPRA